MKKKGLIVATIVMVLVLAVSLTTATYAWFSLDGSAAVTPINFAVANAADVVIGVAEDNAIQTGNFTQAAFYSGDTKYQSNGTWIGDTNALGLAVNTGLDLSSLTGAVYSFASGASPTVYFKETESSTPGAIAGSALTQYTFTGAQPDSSKYYVACADDDESLALTGTYTTYLVPTTYTSANETATASIASNCSVGTLVTTGMVMSNASNIKLANGTDAGVTQSSITNAVKNGYEATPSNVVGNYLDVSFGAAAAKANTVLGMGCMVYVKPTETSNTTLGLNSAIHVAYSTDDTNWTEIDVYGNNHYGDARSTVTAPDLPELEISTTSKAYSSTITPAAGDAYVWIPFYEAATTTAYASNSQIYQLHLVIYLCGEDGDCIAAGTGVGATITIEFLSINGSQWAA